MNAEDRAAKMKDRTGMIDMIAHDTKTGEAVLVMNEPNEWDGSDEQLLGLQERFNAYVSFLLDGEMTQAHPRLLAEPDGFSFASGLCRERAHSGWAAWFRVSLPSQK